MCDIVSIMFLFGKEQPQRWALMSSNEEIEKTQSSSKFWFLYGLEAKSTDPSTASY